MQIFIWEAAIMDRDQETLSELLRDFMQELRIIVMDEVNLAKTEISRKISDSFKEVTYLGIGVFLMYAGLLVLVATLLIILTYIFPLWLAALVTAVVTAGIGYFFIQKGFSDLKHTGLSLKQTIETLKEDREWLKHRIK